MISLCLAGGITPQAAAWFCDLASLYVGAVAYEQSIWAERRTRRSPESRPTTRPSTNS